MYTQGTMMEISQGFYPSRPDKEWYAVFYKYIRIERKMVDGHQRSLHWTRGSIILLNGKLNAVRPTVIIFITYSTDTHFCWKILPSFSKMYSKFCNYVQPTSSCKLISQFVSFSSACFITSTDHHGAEKWVKKYVHGREVWKGCSYAQ